MRCGLLGKMMEGHEVGRLGEAATTQGLLDDRPHCLLPTPAARPAQVHIAASSRSSPIEEHGGLRAAVVTREPRVLGQGRIILAARGWRGDCLGMRAARSHPTPFSPL